MKVLLAIMCLYYPFEDSDFSIWQKQIAWQRMVACRGKITPAYWLSADPNHSCCDINLDGIINFIDYAILTQKK